MEKVGAFLLAFGVGYLGFLVDRTNFWSLFGAFTVSFLGYYLIVRRPVEKCILQSMIGLGIFLRVVLVFAFPLLSDDIYRFIWDGQLIVAGYNPFAELPGYYLKVGNEVSTLGPDLYGRLNSPDYYTIYPPIAQGVFTLAAWIAGGSWYWAGVVMKVFLLGCELLTLGALHRLLAGRRAAILLYWLNPLILVEIMGNLHFEGAMIAALLLGLWLLRTRQIIPAAIALATSVAAKLLPLMLLPFLIKRLWGERFLVFSAAFGFTLLLYFLPLLTSGFLDGFGSSLDLYFRKFEFNASLYYLLRAYGYYDVGWNQIATFGPLLAVIAGLGILLFALLERHVGWYQLPRTWLFAFVGYLLCATTVHPWYLGVPVALCVLTHWRFPLVWSYLVLLTYTSYTTDPYRENLWLVGVEYSVVLGMFIWEWKKRRRGERTGPELSPNYGSNEQIRH